MPTRIHLGLSTCPNDTYLAHALLTGAVETPGLELDIELMDVQELNERLSRRTSTSRRRAITWPSATPTSSS